MVQYNLQNVQFTNLLIFLSFLDYFAVSMIAPQLSLWVRSLGASQVFIGVIGSSYGLIQLFSSTGHGMVSDRYGRRITLILCVTVVMITYTVMGLNTSVVGMLACRIVLGLFKHTQSSLKVIGGDVNVGAERCVFVSKMNSLSGAAFMIGPLLSSQYMHYTQYSYAYSAFSCSFVFSVILVISLIHIKETLPGPSNEYLHPGPTNHTKHPGFIQLVKRYKHLHPILLFRFFAATSVIMLRYFTPLYTNHYFGFDAKHANYLTSFIGFSSIICSLSASYISKMVPDKYRLIKLLSVLLTMSLLSSLLCSDMKTLLLTNFILSFATSNLRVVGDAILLDGCSESERGLVFGLGGSVVGMGRVVAPLVAGVLAQVHMVLPLCASLLLSSLGSGVLFISKIRTE